MAALPLALILVSAFLHAGWNLLSRRDRAEAGFFMRMLLAIVVVGAGPALLAEFSRPRLSTVGFGLALGSGTCCGLYYLFLMLGYRSGDFSVVYPVARALPVLLVGVADILRHRAPGAAGWVGFALVTAGCLLAPHQHLRGLSLAWYKTRAGLWVVLTALGTVGYTVLDKVAAERITPGFASALVYGYVFFATALLVYSVLCRSFVSGPERGRARWTWCVVGATMDFGAYGLVLWVYQLTDRASYVLAFRQVSIVVGVIGGLVLYREKGAALRLSASLIITLGLVLIAVLG